METEIDKVVKEIADSKLSTSYEIKIMKNNILQRLMFDKDEMKHYNKLLTNYRYIDEIDDISIDKFIDFYQKYFRKFFSVEIDYKKIFKQIQNSIKTTNKFYHNDILNNILKK